MRTNLNERSSAELLQIMQYYGYTSTNHTLNILISSLYNSLFNQKHPSDEVFNNDKRSTGNQ